MTGVVDPFSDLMTAMDPAMVVVTAAAAASAAASDGDELAGCLVGFHTQSSIDPPRFCVWLSKANHTYGVALRSTHLGVHLLAADDRDLAVAFGARTDDDATVDKFADHPHTPGPGGVPLLDACPRRFVLRRTVLVDEGGDHVCIAGEPVEVASGSGLPDDFTPLRLSQVDDLEPGHPVDDRRGSRPDGPKGGTGA